MTLQIIRGATVYAPEPLGQQDILLAGDKIVAMAERLDIGSLAASEVDAQGLYAVPGFVDPLAHITGGGGEGGFHTRTPAMELSEASMAGVTTLIACLGTDATTRTLPDLLAKANALCHEGLSVFCYTGSYEVPVRTLLGSVRDDIILLEKMIGVGEIAIADHRGSQLSPQELAKVAAEARVGGMLSGKAGIVFVHVGDADSQLSLIEQAVATSDIPFSQFYPTHLNRSKELLLEGVRLTQQGMTIDVTASTTPELLAMGELSAAQSLALALDAGMDDQMMSFSSDGNASLPEFDQRGQLVGLKVGRVMSMLESFQEAVLEQQVPIQSALRAVSSNAARTLKLEQKGKVAVGKDADLVLLRADDLTVRDVFAAGNSLVRDGKAVKFGTFERRF